jgi:hypothetical protein
MAAQTHHSGESWQQPHPYSWELNTQQDIARSVLQEQIIIKNINAIHALVRLQKPDLHSSLPGLGQKVHNLMDDYQHEIRILTTRLGHDHHQVQLLMERRDQLAGEAKGITWLINSILPSQEPPAAPQGHSDVTTISQGHSNVTTISQGHSHGTTINQGQANVTTISQGHSDVTTISQGPADDNSMARQSCPTSYSTSHRSDQQLMIQHKP